MRSKDYKIDFEIYVVFILVIGISVFNATYSSLNITKNQEMNNKIMAVDIPSLQALENMNLIVTRSEMYTTNWTYIVSSREDKEKLRTLQSVEYPVLKNRIFELMTEWRDLESIDSTKSIFLDFEKLMACQKQIMKGLAKFDDYQDPMKKFSAEEIIESQIIPRTSQIIFRLNGVITNKKNQADALHASMRASYRTLIWSVLGIAIMVVMVILFAAFYLSNNMIVPLMKLKNHILQMGKGEIPVIDTSAKKNAVGLMTEAVRKLSESIKSTTGFAHNIGEGNFKVEFEPLGPKDELGNALIQMRESLSAADADNKERHWLATGLDKISKVLRENTDNIEKLSEEIIGALVRFLGASNGSMYLLEKDPFNEEPQIKLSSSHTPSKNKNLLNHAEIIEGLIGEAIKNHETVYLKNVSNENNHGTNAPQILIVLLKNHGVVYGAVELTSLREFKEQEIKFIENIGETIASTIASSKTNTFTKNLLEETRKQAVRLAAKEDELRQTNRELSSQSLLLQASEDELRKSNSELKENAKLVEEQNERLEQAREALSIKVKELELNSKYKSEFLANMSHELRTPLNSVLILAKLLTENKNTTLTEKEIEYAKVIHKSGSDLLMLINDVLDLSKIEAGKIELRLAKESVKQIKDDMQSLFAEVANQKKIDFSIEVHTDVPEFIVTDKLRIEQIIKNLLSNAFKFTREGGSVEFKIKTPDKRTRFKNQNLLLDKKVIEFSVSDSGIGIPIDQQQIIFEAFQQADGSINRKYGGTGLGLSISRMLVTLLGGELQLISEKGKGSTFFLFVPLESLQNNLTAGDYQSEGLDTFVPFRNVEPDECEMMDKLSGNISKYGNNNSGFIKTGNAKEKYFYQGETGTKSTTGFVSIQNSLSKKMHELFHDKKVLIVDDDMRNIYALTGLLEQQGMNVVTAGDAKEALIKIERHAQFDIVLIGCMLKETDRISAIKEIRKQKKLEVVPIIVQTNKTVPEEREKYIQAGASDQICKPINSEQLLSLMHVWLFR